MRVLVTGSTSMIGAAVVSRLIARGDRVTVLQRRPSARTDVEPINGDISDEAVLERATAGAEGVIHLAAKVGIVGSWQDFEQTNVVGTQRLISAAQRAGVRRFVHVSTPSVAHAGEALVGAGAGPAQPDRVSGHYARSKAIAECHALAQHRDDFALVALRPHLVWGPGDTQLVQRIIDRARAGRLALVDNGLALIDTTFVDNAAEAIVAAVDRAPVIGGQALVVSNGQPRTVSEVLQRILSASGISWEPRFVPATIAVGAGTVAEHLWEWTGRTEDPPMTRFLAEQLATAHWFDQRRTQDALQWRPSVGIEEGFRRLTDHRG